MIFLYFYSMRESQTAEWIYIYIVFFLKLPVHELFSGAEICRADSDALLKWSQHFSHMFWQNCLDSARWADPKHGSAHLQWSGSKNRNPPCRSMLIYVSSLGMIDVFTRWQREHQSKCCFHFLINGENGAGIVEVRSGCVAGGCGERVAEAAEA